MAARLLATLPVAVLQLLLLNAPGCRTMPALPEWWAGPNGAFRYNYDTDNSFNQQWRDERGHLTSRYGWRAGPSGPSHVSFFWQGFGADAVPPSDSPFGPLPFGNLPFGGGGGGFPFGGGQPPVVPQPPRPQPPRPQPPQPNEPTEPSVYPDRYVPRGRPTVQQSPVDEDEDFNYRNALSDFNGPDVQRPGGVLGPPLRGGSRGATDALLQSASAAVPSSKEPAAVKSKPSVLSS